MMRLRLRFWCRHRQRCREEALSAVYCEQLPQWTVDLERRESAQGGSGYAKAGRAQLLALRVGRCARTLPSRVDGFPLLKSRQRPDRFSSLSLSQA